VINIAVIDYLSCDPEGIFSFLKSYLYNVGK